MSSVCQREICVILRHGYLLDAPAFAEAPADLLEEYKRGVTESLCH